MKHLSRSTYLGAVDDWLNQFMKGNKMLLKFKIFESNLNPDGDRLKGLGQVE